MKSRITWVNKPGPYYHMDDRAKFPNLYPIYKDKNGMLKRIGNHAVKIDNYEATYTIYDWRGNPFPHTGCLSSAIKKCEEMIITSGFPARREVDTPDSTSEIEVDLDELERRMSE